MNEPLLPIFSLNTFQSLRNMTTPPNNVSILDSAMGCHSNSGIRESNDQDIHVEECCICLYALAPFQCLFVAPCSHTFHYKCVTPLLVNHPGFNCPLCRSYADLDASVAVEASEVSTAGNHHPYHPLIWRAILFFPLHRWWRCTNGKSNKRRPWVHLHRLQWQRLPLSIPNLVTLSYKVRNPVLWPHTWLMKYIFSNRHYHTR